MESFRVFRKWLAALRADPPVLPTQPTPEQIEIAENRAIFDRYRTLAYAESNVPVPTPIRWAPVPSHPLPPVTAFSDVRRALAVDLVDAGRRFTPAWNWTKRVTPKVWMFLVGLAGIVGAVAAVITLR